MSTAPRRIGVEINPNIIGGAESFLRTLFAHIDRARFVPVAFAAADGRWRSYFGDVVETAVVEYIDSDGFPADVAGALKGMRLDLVQSSYFSPATAAAAGKGGIPHVWRVGGHLDSLDREWTAAEKNNLLAIMKLTSRRVVCPSQFLRGQFDAVGSADIEVIRNGVDLTAFPPPVPRSAGAPPSVAMVAHLVPPKRHGVFLRAAAEAARALPDLRVFVFGGRYPRPELRTYEESLRALAGDLGIAPAVEFRELRGERFEVIRDIDVIALPAVNEGASNALLEAMALCRPVVAARSGSNAEIVEDQVTGLLVEPEDPESLAAALIDLLQDEERRARMGRAGRARVESQFDIRTCAATYETFYDSVLTG